MPVDAALLELMTQVFVWKKKTGQDRWQNPVFTVQDVQVVGYQVDEEHEVTDANGVKRTAKGVLYLADVYGISVPDVIEWCDESVGDLIRVKEWRDEKGPYGSEVHYG